MKKETNRRGSGPGSPDDLEEHDRLVKIIYDYLSYSVRT